MTREEVIKGLEKVLGFMQALSSSGDGEKCDALRAAIDLLQPVGDAEIEAARVSIRCNAHAVNWHDDCPFCQRCRLYLRALDALAREPGLKQAMEHAVLSGIDKDARIAALEAERDDYRARWVGVDEALQAQSRADLRLREQIAALEADLERARAAALVLTSQCIDADTLHLADEQSIRNMEARLARVREAAQHALAWHDALCPIPVGRDVLGPPWVAETLAALAADAGPVKTTEEYVADADRAMSAAARDYESDEDSGLEFVANQRADAGPESGEAMPTYSIPALSVDPDALVSHYAAAREPPATEPRYWIVGPMLTNAGMWLCVTVDKNGHLQTQHGPPRMSRAEAEADGRASGLPAWQPNAATLRPLQTEWTGNVRAPKPDAACEPQATEQSDPHDVVCNRFALCVCGHKRDHHADWLRGANCLACGCDRFLSATPDATPDAIPAALPVEATVTNKEPKCA